MSESWFNPIVISQFFQIPKDMMQKESFFISNDVYTKYLLLCSLLAWFLSDFSTGMAVYSIQQGRQKYQTIIYYKEFETCSGLHKSFRLFQNIYSVQLNAPFGRSNTTLVTSSIVTNAFIIADNPKSHENPEKKQLLEHYWVYLQQFTSKVNNLVNVYN